ncbi:hypothetical protein [Frigoriglobus tundricola]|uniref:Uncharacterized protein n=1 Tax=Frigoriglobus tundricola TaxID=2774151 RepID=A0A6M5YRN2_9BACT|nr:hypothetical protein [Frigoriglobus tundricola]QJW95921.1 hypothetical protein FTUN_3475 [Frigoriglobus tundricola]
MRNSFSVRFTPARRVIFAMKLPRPEARNSRTSAAYCGGRALYSCSSIGTFDPVIWRATAGSSPAPSICPLTVMSCPAAVPIRFTLVVSLPVWVTVLLTSPRTSETG